MRKIFLVMLFLAAAATVAPAQYVQRTLVRVAQMPGPLPNVFHMQGPLSDFLSKYYPTYASDSAFKVVTNNVVTFEIGLLQGRARRKLVYDQNGTFCKFGINNISLTPIQLPNVMDLPTPILEFLRRQYSNSLINSAFKITSNANLITYEVGMTKGTVRETYYFSGSGAFIRSEINDARSSYY